MTSQPVCDSVPPLAALATARVPHVGAESDVGAVVGVVTESGGFAPLPYGDASLLRRSGDVAVAGPVRVDSVGGFALTGLSPGNFVLRVRALNHEARERTLIVKPGTVDTVHISLRYYVCHGY